jgi:hypothetical protein
VNCKKKAERCLVGRVHPEDSLKSIAFSLLALLEKLDHMTTIVVDKDGSEIHYLELGYITIEE